MASNCEICGDKAFRDFLLINKDGKRMSRCTVTYVKQLDGKHLTQMVVCGKVFHESGREADPGEFIVWKDGDGHDVVKTAKTLAFV